MNRIASILGGLMVAICPFLSFVKGIPMSMWESGGFSGTKGPIYAIIAIGVVIMIVGLVNKRWLNILNILLALAAGGLGAMFIDAAKDKGAEAGIGIWVMIAGGVVALIGAIMGVAKKQAA